VLKRFVQLGVGGGIAIDRCNKVFALHNASKHYHVVGHIAAVAAAHAAVGSLVGEEVAHLGRTLNGVVGVEKAEVVELTDDVKTCS